MSTDEPLMSKTPAERVKELRARRAAEAKAQQERETEAAKKRHEELRKYSADAAKRVEAKAESAASMAALCKSEAKFPVKLGNLLGPEGNVFNVIGAVRSGIRWAEKHGVLLPEEAYEIVRGYRGRSYDETLDLIAIYGLDLDQSILRLRDQTYANVDISFGDAPLRGFFG